MEMLEDMVDKPKARKMKVKTMRDRNHRLLVLRFFFSKVNSERLHPSSARHDDSQDDLQLISTYDHRRSLYRSYILRISCHFMFQIYSSSSQCFCW